MENTALPSCTCVQGPFGDIVNFVQSRQAMNMALALMAAGDSIAPFSDIVVKGRLTVRETT